ncbi:MAG TPA: HAMP domain-containing sensor histidine kinase [Pyrinomonadaceae bacterium]|nr:HAMP domain-containing sensor histidine kinase [Pyrinomonadaceae bacterium]
MLSLRVFRETIRNLSLRKKLIILASVGVLLPVLVLSYLQYRSLSELQNKTKGAFKDNLRQGFTNLQRQMRQRLEDIATQTLNPIGSMNLSAPGSAAEVEKYFAKLKLSHPEIEQIFVFIYRDGRQEASRYAYFHSGNFVDTAQTDFTVTQATILAQFEKSKIAQSFLDGDRKYSFVHHSCPACPPSAPGGAYLFHPLKDRTTGVERGFAGVLLTDTFVRDDLLAKTISDVGGASHTGNSPFATAVTVSDENQRVLYANGAAQNGSLLESNFDPPFSSWKATVGLKNTNLDALARNGFLHSAGSTVLVLLFLLLGLALIIRATDREARLAQAKSNFVANVSHELKTPLSLLSLFSEILELDRVKSDEKKSEYYRIIRDETRRLNKLIDNILDFSKIEAGRKTYNFVEGDLAEVIEKVLGSYQYQTVNSGFDVQTNIQPDLPPVLIDRDAMTQAISNLLDNAIKYSRDTRRISIKTETVRSDLFIEIADNGIGIPRAEQGKIFEKFYRVGNGLVHDVKGSGLGLSLVKHIIEAHHGTISVDSEVGKGSRFTIRLPFAPRSTGV